MNNFWKLLPRPFSVLAPMEDVTDTVFRRLIGSCGAPDVYFTEFTSTDGLCSKGRDAVIHRLQFTEGERPLVAQIWGNTPEHYYKTAQLLTEMGFDGIDINLGCPVPKIVKNGCCSALIDNPTLVAELYQATTEGAPQLPVSIKTRLGFKRKVTEEWSQFLLELNPAVLTMHGRTARQMSKVPANWDEIAKVVEIRNALQSDTIVIGNGDVTKRSQFAEFHERYGVDGIMVGRGIFQDPYLFDLSLADDYWEQQSEQQKLSLLLTHIRLHRSVWGERKPYAILKKFFKIYVSSFAGASELRTLLMQTNSMQDAADVIEQWLQRSPASDDNNQSDTIR